MGLTPRCEKKSTMEEREERARYISTGGNGARATIRKIEREQKREQAIDRNRKVRDTRRINVQMCTY